MVLEKPAFAGTASSHVVTKQKCQLQVANPAARKAFAAQRFKPDGCHTQGGKGGSPDSGSHFEGPSKFLHWGVHRGMPVLRTNQVLDGNSKLNSWNSQS